jgi:hypothetical protein
MKQRLLQISQAARQRRDMEQRATGQRARGRHLRICTAIPVDERRLPQLVVRVLIPRRS